VVWDLLVLFLVWVWLVFWVVLGLGFKLGFWFLRVGFWVFVVRDCIVLIRG